MRGEAPAAAASDSRRLLSLRRQPSPVLALLPPEWSLRQPAAVAGSDRAAVSRRRDGGAHTRRLGFTAHHVIVLAYLSSFLWRFVG